MADGEPDVEPVELSRESPALAAHQNRHSNDLPLEKGDKDVSRSTTSLEKHRRRLPLHVTLDDPGKQEGSCCLRKSTENNFLRK